LTIGTLPEVYLQEYGHLFEQWFILQGEYEQDFDRLGRAVPYQNFLEEILPALGQ